MLKTADLLIITLEKWIGIKSNKAIIDNYNSRKPLPRCYKVKYTDKWCATGLSSAIYHCKMEDLIGVECGCEEFINIFKSKGIWYEDGTRTPKRGDIILYNWDDNTQANDGWADHIGVVTEVINQTITVIECNYKKTVGYRTIPLKWCYIRGFARPHYYSSSQLATLEAIVKEVFDGKWGNGEERKKRLTDAGYDYSEVQFIVNSILKAQK